jgi:N-acetylmuramic acid 6-phosphate etherase
LTYLQMTAPRPSPSAPWFVGIEAGATHTVALAVAGNGRPPCRVDAGPANLCLLDDRQLVRLFRTIARSLPPPAALAIGMAGARTEADHERIRKAAAAVWPGVSCYATSDLETGLMAAGDGDPSARRAAARSRRAALSRVLVLSGTGSCCFGRSAEGSTVRVGGWGHILGDRGSGYEIGLRALQAVVHACDCDNRWPALGQRLLRALALNEPEDLVGWAQGAGKNEVGALAVEVFQAWSEHDPIAADVLSGVARTLANDAAVCARRVARRGSPVQFVLAGSVLVKQARFAAWVTRELRRLWPQAIVTPLTRESVWGAVELARQSSTARSAPCGVAPKLVPPKDDVPPLRSLLQSPTEQRNPRSMQLDRLPLRDAIALMIEEDKRIPPALLAQRRPIERGLRLIIRSFQRGGRLFYAGAGTSGRLGVLDASECPPTFRTSPDMVQGIIAGGQSAIWSSVEGAEDDADAGARAVEFRRVRPRDTVVGIAASGRTPFVWGALREAKRRRAATVLVCFNPHVVIPRSARPDVVIAPNVGPELLTGSTRLKSGTATKLVLNLFTTLAMVRMGKVRSNLMIDVSASNIKLCDRATRIVQALTQADYETARAALEATDWKIEEACGHLSPRRPARRRT